MGTVTVVSAPGGAPQDLAIRPAGERRVTCIRAHAFTWAAAGIVVLAAVLRIWRLDMAEFKGDELQVTRLAFALAQHGQWPERGILSSLGTFNSPLFVYFEALPALVWASPLALTAFVAALNVAAVALAIAFARRYFGPVAALVAGVLFATAPWAVVYSRKIWEQDLLPPFVLLFFLGLFLAVVDRKPRALLLCGVAAGVTVQLHPSAIVLPIIALVALLLWPSRFPWRSVASAGALAALVMLPYLFTEWQHRFSDWQYAFAGSGHLRLGPFLGISVGVINWAQAASGWQVISMFRSSGTAQHDPASVTIATWLAGSLLAAATIHLVVHCRRLWMRRVLRQAPGAQATVLLALWLLLPPLLLGLSGLLTFPHYFIVSFPAPFLAIGLLVDTIGSGGRRWRTAALALVAVLALANVATITQVLRAAGRAPFPNDYGLPLAFDNRIATAISQDAAGRPAVVSVATAFRDGQQVIDQLVVWKSGPVDAAAAAAPRQRYWVLPNGIGAPTGAHLLLALGPVTGPPIAIVWAGDRVSAGGTLP